MIPRRTTLCLAAVLGAAPACAATGDAIVTSIDSNRPVAVQVTDSNLGAEVGTPTGVRLRIGLQGRRISYVRGVEGHRAGQRIVFRDGNRIAGAGGDSPPADAAATGSLTLEVTPPADD